jgi:hypothetical protein
MMHLEQDYEHVSSPKCANAAKAAGRFVFSGDLGQRISHQPFS